MTRVVHAPSELRAVCDARRVEGARVGLVPTMGALHDGHLSLVDAVRDAGATDVVATIFVNPLQFDQGGDLERYPRTLPRDVELLEARGVELVYAPSAATMYPDGFQTHVDVEQVSLPLEGASRPGHYRGVTTVVTKLFNATGPCVAAFGLKDYQQLQVIQRMVQDLDMPVDVLPCPIHREDDGLAMSSRNRFLSPDERTRALAIHQGFELARKSFASGERDVARLQAIVHGQVALHFDRVDYVAVAHPRSLQPVEGDVGPGGVQILVAARLGETRLIDNMHLAAVG